MVLFLLITLLCIANLAGFAILGYMSFYTIKLLYLLLK